MPRARLLKWQPLEKNTLIGVAKVQFTSGLIIAEIAVHRYGDRTWAQPPARALLDAAGNVMRDDRDRIKYQPLISFANHGVQSSWSRQVIQAIKEVHPDLFPTSDPMLPLS